MLGCFKPEPPHLVFFFSQERYGAVEAAGYTKTGFAARRYQPVALLVRGIFTGAESYFGVFYRSISRIIQGDHREEVQPGRVKAYRMSTMKALCVLKI